ncbi:MAG: hypothetical protein DRP42_02515 [Tenericutes bacterium]|nr:MAG: hypothetical protein DRP42_02515 [Mycoplasmatota bacterium]
MIYPIFEVLIISAIAVSIAYKSNNKNNGRSTLLLIIFYILASTTHALTSNVSASSLEVILTIILVSSFYLTAYSLFLFQIIFIEKLYKQFYSSEKRSMVDENNFVRITLSKEQTKAFITENKIERAGVFSFGIPTLNKLHNAEALSLLLKYLQDEINKAYPGVYINFMKFDNNSYGFFMEIPEEIDLDVMYAGNTVLQRKGDDFFKPLQKILNSVSIEKKSPVRVGVSLYGIHSYDLEELIDTSKYISRYLIDIGNKNAVSIFEPSKIKQILIDKSQLISMTEIHQNSHISLIKSYNPEGIILYPLFKATNKYGQNIEVLDTIQTYTRSEAESIFRYYGMITLKASDKAEGKLVVPYLLSLFENSEFNLEIFKTKLKMHRPLKDIIVGFYVINKRAFSPKELKIVEKLRKAGIKIAILNIDEASEKQYKELAPDYVFFKKNRTVSGILSKHQKNPRTIKFKISSKVIN